MDAGYSNRQHLSAGVPAQPRACLSLSECVCDPLAEAFLSTPPSPPPPAVPSSALPILLHTSHHCSLHYKEGKKNWGPFYSCTCDCDCETHLQNFLVFPLITASRQRLHHGEKAKISYRRYTCAGRECQILSQ